MKLIPQGDGTYRANGRKYYIGNANKAALVSTLGKMGDSGILSLRGGDDPREIRVREEHRHVQSYVAEYALHDYPIYESDILSKGQDAWDAALNTVNVGKYNLGWASIGICTHAFYEAIHHAANRVLYGKHVTTSPYQAVLTEPSAAWWP